VPGYTGYSAAKAGLLGLVRSFAAELAADDVQVNAICPGWVATDMARAGIDLMADDLGIAYAEAFEPAMAEVPLGRMSERRTSPARSPDSSQRTREASPVRRSTTTAAPS